MSAEGRQTSSKSDARSFVFGEQVPFLRNLYQAGEGLALPGAQGAQQAGDALSQAFAPGLMNAFQNTSALTNPQAQIDAQSQSRAREVLFLPVRRWALALMLRLLVSTTS